MKLSEKVVLITGGSSGIGAQIARLFAAEGAKTIITYHISSESAHTLAGEIKKSGGRMECFQADLQR